MLAELEPQIRQLAANHPSGGQKLCARVRDVFLCHHKLLHYVAPNLSPTP